MSRQNKYVLGGLMAIIFFVSTGTFFIRNKRTAAIPVETQLLFAGQADGMTYTDIKGNKISLEQYLGKVLIVTSWASWSPFTTSDLANLNDFVSKYDRNEVVALGINRMETRAQAERYLATIPELPYLILVIDTTDHFYKSVGGYAMPETLVFDPKGEVAGHIRGSIVKDEMGILVDSLLSQGE